MYLDVVLIRVLFQSDGLNSRTQKWDSDPRLYIGKTANQTFVATQ